MRSTGLEQRNFYLDAGYITAELDFASGKLEFKCSGDYIANGTGIIDNFDNPTQTPWYQYRDIIKEIILGEGITRIGHFAFAECFNVETVILASTITEIGANAFDVKYIDENNNVIKSLKKVVYTGDLTSWLGITFNNQTHQNSAYYYYANPVVLGKYFYLRDNHDIDRLVTEITIPEGIEYIKPFCFAGFSELTKVDFSAAKDLRGIQNQAFWGCTKLTEIDLPKNIGDPPIRLSIGTLAFDDCYRLARISIPNNIELSGSYIFNSCSQLTIYCESKHTINRANTNWNSENRPVVFGIKARGCTDKDPEKDFSAGIHWELSFENNIELTGYTGTDTCLQVPDKINNFNVTKIRPYAFAHGRFTEVLFHTTSLTEIMQGAFANCANLTEIELPTNLETLGDGVFLNCNKLTSVVLNKELTNIGAGVFLDCLSLRDFSASANSHFEIRVAAATGHNSTFKFLCTSEAGKYNILYTTLGAVPSTNNINDLFSINLNTIFNNKLESISSYAFKGCRQLGQVVIPGTVTYVGKSAFEECKKLNSITIYESDMNVVFDYNAFKDCSKLNNINFIGSISNWCLINFKNKFANPLYYDVDNCGRYEKQFLPKEEATNVNTWTEINNGALTLTNVYAVPDCTFINNTKLTSIIFNNAGLSTESVAIGEAAFKNSTLSSISFTTIPAEDDQNILKTSFIGRSAFEKCLQLENITFEIENAQSDFYIADYAFKNTTLRRVQLPDMICNNNYTGTAYIGNFVFDGAFSYQAAEGGALPDTGVYLLSTPARFLARFNLSNIETLIISEDGTILENNAFESAVALKSLAINFNNRLSNMLNKLTALSFKNCISLATIVSSNRLENEAYLITENCIVLRVDNTLEIIFGANQSNMKNIIQNQPYKDLPVKIRDYAFINRTFSNDEQKQLPATTVYVGKEIF